MNIYDSIKFAANKGWEIKFDTNTHRVIVRDQEGVLGICTWWENPNGLITSATALMRAIGDAKVAIGRK